MGHLSILLEAVNVVPFFQYFTVMLNLAEKKLTFFSAPPVGVLYEPPGPTVGHLQPFQEKMTNARQMPRGMDKLEVGQFRYIKIHTWLRGLGEYDTSHQPNRRPRLITLTETLIILDTTKPETTNCLLYIYCYEGNNDKHTIARNEV